ncbi:MAG: TolC family protein [Desulfobacterales bacterium]|nr:TolC family protein [Desulfobacteraceae bacterium]MBT4365680.1 TolC family protein [Desulfobacteraceae bacterium]MBT7086320.1 TolC family protein [Desulfobacterales bacterium]MBT7696727.1 TolC family protein [Desulfobacterales bacterium]
MIIRKIIIIAFSMMLLCNADLFAEETGSDSSTMPEKEYSLPDLYSIALERAERVIIAEQNLFIARKYKDKAFAVLVPRVTGFGNYTEYDESTVAHPRNSAMWGVRLDQSFTMNGKELLAFKIAENNIDKNRYDLESVKEEYLFQVAFSFYDLWRAKTGVEIALVNVERLEKYKESVLIKLKIEELTQTALFRAEAELSGAKTDLVRAKNNHRLAKRALATITGLKEKFNTRDPDLTVEEFALEDLERLKNEALKERPEIKSLDIQSRISDFQVRLSKSAYWPSVSIEGVYSNQENNPASSSPTENFSAGVSMSVPIFDGGLKKADIEEALARKRQTNLAYRELEKYISLEVEQVFYDLMTKRSIIKSLKDQREFANENYNAVERQFKYGLADSINVMDANALLLTSEKKLSEAKYSLKITELKLKRVKGSFIKTEIEK